MAAAIPWIIMAVAAAAKMKEAEAKSDALKDQEKISNYNAEVNRQQAKSTLDISAANQMRQRREARQILGRQRAAAAQSGVGFGGSTADLLDRSETLAELDALNIAYDGVLKARGFTSQAEIDDFNARAYGRQAKQVKSAGFLGAIGSFAPAFGGK